MKCLQETETSPAAYDTVRVRVRVADANFGALGAQSNRGVLMFSRELAIMLTLVGGSVTLKCPSRPEQYQDPETES